MYMLYILKSLLNLDVQMEFGETFIISVSSTSISRLGQSFSACYPESPCTVDNDKCSLSGLWSRRQLTLAFTAKSFSAACPISRFISTCGNKFVKNGTKKFVVKVDFGLVRPLLSAACTAGPPSNVFFQLVLISLMVILSSYLI